LSPFLLHEIGRTSYFYLRTVKQVPHDFVIIYLHLAATSQDST